ncbi:putative speedy protein E7 [Nycticebus coucang]|uniref:putative speedy protein E7 n=1 Tax=Nycticebus coucang TaxID=9470 RepID=UPI00234CA57E|nr:putative speedy protein E7 [Nycticebus coucang]
MVEGALKADSHREPALDGCLESFESHGSEGLKVPSKQQKPRKEAQEGSFYLAKKDHREHFLPAAPRNWSPPASGSASSVAVSEQRTGRKRARKTKHLEDVKAATCESGPATSNSASSEADSDLKFSRKKRQRRSLWTVSHVEGTKLRMNRKKVPSYRPEDQEAFYRLLEDPAIQSFLEADIFLKVSDKYLLSMVVEYFGRVGLPGHLYNRIHFFLALYIASDMEEDDPTSKQSIFQFLLGEEHWPDLYKEFLNLRMEFFHAMGYRAWVTPELCEEIQAQNPHHWVWSRVRQSAP